MLGSRFVHVPLACALACACACNSNKEDDPLAPLEQETQVPWRAVFHPVTHLVTTLDGYRGTFAASPSQGLVLVDSADRARDFLAAHPELFGPAATKDGLAFVGAVPDPLGGVRVRFELHASLLPVEGGDVVVTLAPSGEVRAVAGELPAAARIDTAPVLDAAAAQQAAIAYVARVLPTAVFALEAPPELVATLQDDDTRLRAAWRILLAGDTLRREIFVDAVTGDIQHERQARREIRTQGSGLGTAGVRLPLEIYQGADGTFQLRDDTRGPAGIRTFSAQQTDELPGWQITSTDAILWDEGVPGAGAAVSAHYFAGVVFDYLRSVHGRESLDGLGGGIRLVVHHGTASTDAFWDGHRAVFGDGDGRSTTALAGALDLVAHELFHGVTQADSGLIYEGEPGALAESLSDVFATFVELDAEAGNGNWTIGEAVANPPLRDLAAPWRGGSPAHVSQLVQQPDDPDHDMGAVHANSTIASHAAYLLAMGGMNAVSGFEVTAIGVEHTRQIWYRAASLYLGPRGRFADFAEATHVAAEDLFGRRSQEVKSVDQTWAAVGVTQ